MKESPKWGKIKGKIFEGMIRLKKAVCVLLGILLVLGAVWFFLPGCLTRSDVYLADFAVPAHGEDMTVTVGVASSMGYVRACKNVSDAPAVITLRFYGAFGGLNGKVGAKNQYVLTLDEACQSIRFETAQGYQEVLVKDGSGQWVRP